MKDWFGVSEGTEDFSDSGAHEWDGVFELVQCRRALSPSGLPHLTYALNPYGGCEHGCVYCYAPEVTHQQWNGWRVVKVKTNVVSRLSRELPGLSGTIGIGTVTDPYQGAEKRFRLTRKCLEILSSKSFGVEIYTKSDLVLRDTDLLKSMRCTVGVTVTTLDERISKITEPGAPMPSVRLDTLCKLRSEGIDCFAMVAPVLDHLSDHEDEFAEALASTGVERAMVDPLNRRPQLMQRLERMGFGCSPSQAAVVADSLRAHGIRVD